MPEFARWMGGMKGIEARSLVSMRIRRLQVGLVGDVRDVGEGVFELRINSGPGYRVYGTRSDGSSVTLLCGGDKGSQARDVARAKRMVRALRGGRSTL
ncbi:addiction module antitoxin RelB [Gordonibacter sp. 28C]|nr:addiction module antitoxin RelB [Gordonibacter sp. 28C]